MVLRLKPVYVHETRKGINSKSGNRQPLTREQMKRVIEGLGNAGRIPIAVQAWVDPNVFGTKADEYRAVLNETPCDIEKINLNIPQIFDAPADDPSYRWLNFDNPFPAGTALDAVSALDDWEKLDSVLADFPSPDYPGLIPKNVPPKGDRYRVGLWWYWLFERLWSVRGMENALCDFYENEEEVHRLFRALTNFYKGMLTRAKMELDLDAVWTSDDIGTQTSAFFSLEIFQTFFKPYYQELIEHAHSLGMHFWLHTCGNVRSFIPDLIEIGLDILHPIQKHTMDEKEIAEQFGNDICIWAGIDVQRVVPFGTPQEVREEVRAMINTYYRPQGRLILAAGNNMTVDTPLENLRALLEEAYTYGTKIVEGRP